VKVVLDTSAVLAWLPDEPLTEADAVSAAKLWSRPHTAGLSLGDRCCRALGARLDLTTVTADATWTDLDLESPVQVIR
jgi:PIN domain nuclease of toxin-antitoxin system